MLEQAVRKMLMSEKDIDVTSAMQKAVEELDKTQVQMESVNISHISLQSVNFWMIFPMFWDGNNYWLRFQLSTCRSKNKFSRISTSKSDTLKNYLNINAIILDFLDFLSKISSRMDWDTCLLAYFFITEKQSNLRYKLWQCWYNTRSVFKTRSTQLRCCEKIHIVWAFINFSVSIWTVLWKGILLQLLKYALQSLLFTYSQL